MNRQTSSLLSYIPYQATINLHTVTGSITQSTFSVRPSFNKFKCLNSELNIILVMLNLTCLRWLLVAMFHKMVQKGCQSLHRYRMSLSVLGIRYMHLCGRHGLPNASTISHSRDLSELASCFSCLLRNSQGLRQLYLFVFKDEYLCKFLRSHSLQA